MGRKILNKNSRRQVFTQKKAYKYMCIQIHVLCRHVRRAGGSNSEKRAVRGEFKSTQRGRKWVTKLRIFSLENKI